MQIPHARPEIEAKWRRWHWRLFGPKCVQRSQPRSWRLWITELLAEKVMNDEDAVQMAEELQSKQLHQLFSPRQLPYPRERSEWSHFFFFFYKELQLPVSHIRAHQHWSCDTPGGYWQLSTLVNACHLLLSISSPSSYLRPRLSPDQPNVSVCVCDVRGALTLKRLQLGRCDVSTGEKRNDLKGDDEGEDDVWFLRFNMFVCLSALFSPFYSFSCCCCCFKVKQS